MLVLNWSINNSLNLWIWSLVTKPWLISTGVDDNGIAGGVRCSSQSIQVMNPLSDTTCSIRNDDEGFWDIPYHELCMCILHFILLTQLCVYQNNKEYLKILKSSLVSTLVGVQSRHLEYTFSNSVHPFWPPPKWNSKREVWVNPVG